MIGKVLRKLVQFGSFLRSEILKNYYKISYRGIHICNKSYLYPYGTIISSNESNIWCLDSVIGRGTSIIANEGGKIRIEKAFIGNHCMIAAKSQIEIHPNCQIAEMVVIRDQNHNFGAAGKTIVEQGFSTAPIIIEENVWLGAKVTVLAGSHIGKNTVVGANSVVRGKLEPNSVYAGIPAKKIKSF